MIVLSREITSTTIQHYNSFLCFIVTTMKTHGNKAYLTLPYLTLPYLTSPHLTSPHLTSPHLISSHLISPHLTSPHLISSHLILPYLTLYYLILSRRIPHMAPTVQTSTYHRFSKFPISKSLYSFRDPRRVYTIMCSQRYPFFIKTSLKSMTCCSVRTK